MLNEFYDELNDIYQNIEFKREKVYAYCNCSGVYLYHKAVLPKTALKDGYANLKKTIARSDGTCKFCDHYAVFKPKGRAKRKYPERKKK